MDLRFDRGSASHPVGHALLYWQAGDGVVLASYVNVPPIAFDLAKYVPPFLQQMTQGMDLGNAMVLPPVPPIPEQVQGYEFLQALAARRMDDLVYVGAAYLGNLAQLAGELQEAAARYGDLYHTATDVGSTTELQVPERSEPSRFAGMSERERLNELTQLTGRFLDAQQAGVPDAEIEGHMEQLARELPSKYRVPDLITAIHEPAQRGRRLAELYIERCYKLFNEEYLDLERIDREIEAANG